LEQEQKKSPEKKEVKKKRDETPWHGGFNGPFIFPSSFSEHERVLSFNRRRLRTPKAKKKDEVT
jgi:hypothetical protein